MSNRKQTGKASAEKVVQGMQTPNGIESVEASPKHSLAKSALVISAGGFIAKLIGAVYRVPLTNLIGAEAIGLYQMVFPLYCALLTLSSTGIPSATSRLIAQNKARPSVYFYRSVFLFGGIGLVGSVIMCVLGGFFAKLQGNALAGRCYIALSPSVFTVSVISCIRGYFQGKGNMAPTAISQIVEQAIKAAFGLTVCYIFRGDAATSALLATLAVSVSEVTALLYLYIRIKMSGIKRERGAYKGVYRQILSLTVPVTLSAIILPLGHVADSFIVVNTMAGYTVDATAIYGVYSGSVAAIIGLPVALAYGGAVACIPIISSGEKDRGIVDSMRFTGFVAIPFSLLLCLFAPQCINFLYGGLPLAIKQQAIKILTLDAVSVLLLSFLQTANAILLSVGKQRLVAASMSGTLVLRVGLCAALTSSPQIGILGAVIAANLSYAVALAINLAAALPRTVLTAVTLDAARCFVCGIICVVGGYFAFCRVEGRLWFALAAAIMGCAYLATALPFLFADGRLSKLRLPLMFKKKNRTCGKQL